MDYLENELVRVQALESLKDEIDDILKEMDVGDVLKIDGIYNKWMNPTRITYVRTLVSIHGKNNNKRFTVKKDNSSHGCELAVKIRRLK